MPRSEESKHRARSLNAKRPKRFFVRTQSVPMRLDGEPTARKFRVFSVYGTIGTGTVVGASSDSLDRGIAHPARNGVTGLERMKKKSSSAYRAQIYPVTSRRSSSRQGFSMP